MPNQGVPVIFKNKIAYGYAEQSVKAYDVSVSDYNALTEQQQLDGSIRFIQGVDAVPNGNNVWAKLGTTPLAEGLPRDCSQAVNELKSNLTDFQESYIHKIDTKSVSANTVTKLVEINITSGIWLFTSHIILNGSATGTYNHYLRDANSLNNLTVRNAGTGGGGSSLSQIMDFPQATTVDVSVYVGTAISVTGQISAIRIGDSLS